MSPDLSVITHEALCAALFYSVFFRAVRASEKVSLDVRAAFFGMGIVASAGMAAPLAWDFAPSAFDLSLLAAIVAVQVVTARHWMLSVPDHFCKPDRVPTNRRADDIRSL